MAFFTSLKDKALQSPNTLLRAPCNTDSKPHPYLCLCLKSIAEMVLISLLNLRFLHLIFSSPRSDLPSRVLAPQTMDKHFFSMSCLALTKQHPAFLKYWKFVLAHFLLLNYFYCKPEQIINSMHLFLRVLQLQQMLNKCYSMPSTNRHGNYSVVAYFSFCVQYMIGMNGHTCTGHGDHMLHTAAMYMRKMQHTQNTQKLARP